jgi:DNA polymerase V
MLTDIIKQDKTNLTIFSDTINLSKQEKIMETLDSINSLYGKDKLAFASSGINTKWTMKREIASKRFTTRWSELLTIS